MKKFTYTFYRPVFGNNNQFIRYEKEIVEVNEEVYRELRSHRNAEKKNREKHNRLRDRCDYIGLDITDHAWNRPHCKNALLIGALTVPDCAEAVIDAFEYKTLVARLHGAIEQLPQKQKQRIVLHYFENLSVNEIACLEGVHPSKIYQSLRAAKKNIVNFL